MISLIVTKVIFVSPWRKPDGVFPNRIRNFRFLFWSLLLVEQNMFWEAINCFNAWNSQGIYIYMYSLACFAPYQEFCFSKSSSLNSSTVFLQHDVDAYHEQCIRFLLLIWWIVFFCLYLFDHRTWLVVGRWNLCQLWSLSNWSLNFCFRGTAVRGRRTESRGLLQLEPRRPDLYDRKLMLDDNETSPQPPPPPPFFFFHVDESARQSLIGL